MHLVAKRLSARLNSSLRHVIQAVNRIKANALSDRLFRQLCDENDEEFNRLLLHTELFNFLKSMTFPNVKICFNEMNKQLQSNELNLIKTKVVISAFLPKLMLFKCNFARGEFCQFPTLAKVSKEVKILEDDVHLYCRHLEMLQGDFLRRFHGS
ncbi:hypothetical protein M514_27282, partial [Trichuris suis]